MPETERFPRTSDLSVLKISARQTGTRQLPHLQTTHLSPSFSFLLSRICLNNLGSKWNCIPFYMQLIPQVPPGYLSRKSRVPLLELVLPQLPQSGRSSAASSRTASGHWMSPPGGPGFGLLLSLSCAPSVPCTRLHPLCTDPHTDRGGCKVITLLTPPALALPLVPEQDPHKLMGSFSYLS